MIIPQELGQVIHNSSASVKETLYHNISQALQRQLATGRPTKHGEVIIEGSFAMRLPPGEQNWHLDYDRIARQSLAAIAKSYGRQDGIASVLKEFAS